MEEPTYAGACGRLAAASGGADDELLEQCARVLELIDPVPTWIGIHARAAFAVRYRNARDEG